MTEVEFQEEMRKKISSLADDVFRLVKTDADIL